MVRQINYQICSIQFSLIRVIMETMYLNKLIQTIKNIVISVTKPNLLNATYFDHPKHIKTSQNTINDLYIQEWNAKLQDSRKGKNYSIYRKNQTLLWTCVAGAHLQCENNQNIKSKKTGMKSVLANHRLPMMRGIYFMWPGHQRRISLST